MRLRLRLKEALRVKLKGILWGYFGSLVWYGERLVWDRNLKVDRDSGVRFFFFFFSGVMKISFLLTGWKNNKINSRIR